MVYSGINGRVQQTQLVERIRERSLLLVYSSRSSNIRVTWCPAHVGIEANELADICAKSFQSFWQFN